jgi:hypothetical protein
MLQLHFEVDLTNKRHVGVLLAAVNAIVEFNMRAAGTPTMQGPQHGPMTTAQPGAPAPAAPAPRAPRKPRGGAAAQQPAQQPGQPSDEPQLFPHAHQQQQPGAPSASFGQPVPGQTLGAPPAMPNVKEQLHAELRNFSTVCGPMALQGLLNYFGCERSSDLPMERVEEIFQYIRAARAQMQQGQG